MLTLITDEFGTRWVTVPPKKTRKPARALKFGNVAVGDQIMLKPDCSWHKGISIYYIVTDRWFDPVAGEIDPIKGQMVGFAKIKFNGELSEKSRTTVRGLASQKFSFADQDFMTLTKNRKKALLEGDVVTIFGARR